MARTRAMILTSIWRDRDFVALKPAAKLVYLALLSQPNVNHLGLMDLTYDRWARDLNGSTEWVRACVAELEAARFVVVDAAAEQLLIRSFMRNDGVAASPNLLLSAANSLGYVASAKIATALLDELALIRAEHSTDKTAPTVDRMEAQLKTLGDGFPEPIAEGFGEGFEEGFASAATKGSKNPLGKGSGNPLGERGSSSGVSTDLAVPRAPAPARARGTRLPADFTVTPEMVAWFRERCPQVDGKTETEKFRNYWTAKTGQAATKLDWPATWRNWMLAAAERLPVRPVSGQPVRSTGELRAEAAIEAGRRAQERADRGEL